MLMLEKTVRLYKTQFDDMLMEIYGDHRLDRYSMDLDAILFRIKYMTKHNKDLDKIPALKKKFTEMAIHMRECFGDFMFGFICKVITIPEPFRLDDLADLIAKDVKIDPNYVVFEMGILSENEDFLHYIDGKIDDDKPFNMFPDKYFRFYTDSYNDGIAKAYPELFENKQQNVIGTGDDADVFVHNFTIQSTEACSMNCTYCYQFNKMPTRMTLDTAKLLIDHLLNDDYGYINRYNSPAIILEFIGGEPLLEAKFTRAVYEYFLGRAYELNHPWFTRHRLSICSNGMQYFDEDVQSLFRDYSSQISFNVSIDGNKELHDACRRQPNGEGSYDISMSALRHYNKYYSKERNSKMTLAPSNISYLFDSVKDFIEQGMTVININCVFEEGWNQKTARTEYEQLKKLADYILENNLEHLYIAIFNERQEDVLDYNSDSTFCFKGDSTILTTNGNIMISDLRIGDLVYDAHGNVNRVTEVHRYFSENNVVLRASGIYDIHCTADHKVLAKKFLYRGWMGQIHYSEPGYYPVSELKKGDRIGLPFLKLPNSSPEFMTNEFAYAIGVFIADGCITRSHNHINAEVSITPGYDEDEFYKNALLSAGLEVRSFMNQTSIVYRIGRDWNPINELFYKICMDCGHTAFNKHFPSIAFNIAQEQLCWMIKGYTDTDGYTVKEGANMGHVKVNSVSKRLMNDLMILLRSIGKFPTCYHYKRAGQMTIEGRTVNIRDRYEVYFSNDIANHSMFKYDDSLNVLWSEIRDVHKDENYDVYCPTVYPIDKNVEANHTIIVNSSAVKNCGGSGAMLAMRPNGQFYPCIRYMPTSVGSEVPDLCIGDVHTGMVGRNENSPILKMLDNITRRSQNNDICYECPINNDCASCLALGHTVFGTPNKRTNFICIQMIAEALANIYYWNALLLKHPEYDLKPRKNNVPDEWSLLVIDQDELDFLKTLELAATASYLDKRLNEEGA